MTEELFEPSMLQEHLRCWRCDYDLFGLPREGKCPECGEAVAETLARPGAMRFDAGWARRVIWGARLVLFSQFVWILRSTLLLEIVFHVSLMGLIAEIVASLVHFVGIYLLLAADSNTGRLVRSIGKVALAALAVLQFCQPNWVRFLILWRFSGPTSNFADVFSVLQIVRACEQGLLALAHAAILWNLQQVLSSKAYPRLQNFARSLFWAVAVSGLAMVVAGTMLAPGLWEMFFEAAAILFLVTTLGYVIFLVLLHVTLSKFLRQRNRFAPQPSG